MSFAFSATFDMKFRDLLEFIPEEDLSYLSAETRVDYQVKKLKGSIVFKLILYTMLESSDSSLRVMERFFNSSKFKLLANVPDIETRHNSLSDRITNIEVGYFEELFSLVFNRFNHHLNEESDIQIYDSTMIALSSKLVDWGMKVGAKTNKVQLKITLGMQGSLPCTFKVFDKPEALCEDKTIPQTILEYDNNKLSIVVFDRGVQKRTTFVGLADEDIVFVTRIKVNVNYQLVKANSFEKVENSSVQITEDLEIFFIERGTRKPIQKSFRLIKGVIKETQKELFLLTNHFELTPYEIADIYKRRWEIEVFFRFIKQQLNFKHLVNRSSNGIKVMVYMTMILAILITVYKKENKLKGYKIVKLKIANELFDSLLREIATIIGGDPNLLARYLNDI